MIGFILFLEAVALCSPGGIVLSDTEKKFPKVLEFFNLRVRSQAPLVPMAYFSRTSAELLITDHRRIATRYRKSGFLGLILSV